MRSTGASPWNLLCGVRGFFFLLFTPPPSGPSTAAFMAASSFSRCLSVLLSVALAESPVSPSDLPTDEDAGLALLLAGASKDGMESISSMRELMSIIFSWGQREV